MMKHEIKFLSRLSNARRRRILRNRLRAAMLPLLQGFHAQHRKKNVDGKAMAAFLDTKSRELALAAEKLILDAELPTKLRSISEPKDPTALVYESALLASRADGFNANSFLVVDPPESKAKTPELAGA